MYTAFVRAHDRLKPIPPTPAQLSLAAMVKSAGAESPEQAVDYLIRRFLQVKPSAQDRELLISFARELAGGDQIDFDSADVERQLRELLHSIMSLPEFQLG